MMITLQMEIGKDSFNNFDSFLSELRENLLNAGREIVREALDSEAKESGRPV